MKVELFVLRKHIFYFLFWWNIWRNMTSDTRSLFRVLLLKSKHKQFSYTCVGWINRSQDNLLHVLLLKKFIVCRTFFCFFNFCRKSWIRCIKYTRLFRFWGNIQIKPKFRHFLRTNHQKKLKTVDVLWKLNCLCCGNIFFIFCFDGIFDEIWRQIHAYFVFCFSNQNIRNFPIPVLVELTEAKTISSCFTIEEVHSLPNLLLLF